MKTDDDVCRIIRAKTYDLTRRVRSILSSPWDQVDFHADLEHLLESGLRNHLAAALADILGEARSSELKADDRLRRKQAEHLIEVELPLVWLHPVCDEVNCRESILNILNRFEIDEQHFQRQLMPYLGSEECRERFAEVFRSGFSEFRTWVQTVIDATESANNSLKMTEALQANLTTLYRQWRGDGSCDRLQMTKLEDFRAWINGVIESIADIEDGSHQLANSAIGPSSNG